MRLWVNVWGFRASPFPLLISYLRELSPSYGLEISEKLGHTLLQVVILLLNEKKEGFGGNTWCMVFMNGCNFVMNL